MKTKGKLPDSLGFLEDKISRGLQSGYVIVRESGTNWQPACVEDFGDSMGEIVCPYLKLQ